MKKKEWDNKKVNLWSEFHCSIETMSLFMMVCLFFLCPGSSVNAKRLVVAGGNIPVRIVSSGTVTADEMGRYMQNFLKERNFSVDPIIYHKQSSRYKGSQWILADADNLSKVGIRNPFSRLQSSCPDESYWMKADQTESGTLILLAGKTDSGLRAAVARLICQVANEGKVLTLESGENFNQPFIKRRILDIGNSARRQVPDGSPFKKVDLETWSLDRLRAYPELFWQFGFNGLQVEEVRGYGALTDQQLPGIRKALQVLAEGARDRGMYVSLFQWGDCLYKEGVTYSWNDPAEHRTMLAFINDLADGYGKYVDHVNIHFGDPGGCLRDGCDSYKTPQQVTAAYYEAFRKVNPKVEFSLSTWAWGDFWSYCPHSVDLSNYNPYFPDMAKAKTFNPQIPEEGRFLDSTFMPLNIGIALHRTYNQDQAKAVLASGRPVDVWTWYVGDNEMINSYWLNMKGVDEILQSLPEEAGKELRSYSFELNFHGWPEIINTYIGGRKLWNPKLPLKLLEKEFCAGAFGPGNADAMVALYEACENGCFSAIPMPKEFGTPAYNQQLREILKQSGSIHLSADWKPNFALPLKAQEYVDQLKSRLKLILCVSEAKEAIEKAKQNHADTQTIEKIKKQYIQRIPDLPNDPLYRQDSSIANEGYRIASFAEMIAHL
jgi:hypothetical protein